MKCPTVVLALAALLTNAPTSGAQTTSAQRAEVLAVADSALAMISRSDRVGLSDLMTPEAISMSIRAGDTVRYRARTRDEVRAQTGTDRITERGFDGEVRVSGPLAVVWLPYDLYINGNWSHCGVDTITLVRLDGKWKITHFAWTVEQPPACRRHPAGPPRGGPTT